mgnify:CR=1 FL=1
MLLVTRPREQARDWVSRLQAAGQAQQQPAQVQPQPQPMQQQPMQRLLQQTQQH